MYIVDFLKSLTKKSNITVLLYLLLNIAIIGGILGLVLSLKFYEGIICGVLVYAVSMFIALSPIGETILRMQNGCKKLTGENKARLEPMFLEIDEQARNEAAAMGTSIPDDIMLYMTPDENPDAFAAGRRTICVTKGLLNLPDDQIRATIAREFGNIVNKNTDAVLLVNVSNLFMDGIILIFRGIIAVIRGAVNITAMLVNMFVQGASAGMAKSVANGLNMVVQKLSDLIVGGFTNLWSTIGTVLVMKASRDNEYEADSFAYYLGYGAPLCQVLQTESDEKEEGLFAALKSSKPDSESRIGRLVATDASNRVRYQMQYS